MKKTILMVMFIVIIAMNSAYSKEDNQDHKKVLVLESYHKGFLWTDEFQRGIEEGLNPTNIEIMTEYMDCYRFYHDETFEELYQYYQEKYADERIDVVVVIDNFAYDFMNLYQDKLFKGIPIVFGGVNNFSKTELINDMTTGIAQNDSQVEMIELILKLHPKTKTILVAGTQSATAIADSKALIKEGENAYKNIVFKEVLTGAFEDEILQLKKYNAHETVVIATGTMKDKHGNFLNHSDFSKSIIEATGLPVYAMAKSYIDDGAIGGLAVDSYVHGQMVADYTGKLLSGVKLTDLPIVEKPVVGYVFDYNRLKQFQIDEKQLPKDSTVLNGPSKDLIIDKTQAKLIIVVIILMGLLLLGFVIHNIREKKVKKIIMETKGQLRENNLELEAKNRFLEDSKEKLKVQYQELAQNKEHIEYLAYYDTVTHLMKRDKLMDTLNQIISTNPNTTACIYDVDISNLKTINDTYGHEVGNRVLEKIAQSLADHYQSEHILLGTHHSEFIIVYLSEMSEEEALLKAQKVIKSALWPLKIGNKEIDLQVSVGIAFYPKHGDNPANLLKNANIAMLEAIKSGLNVACLYEEKFYHQIVNRLELEKQLKKAVILNEFELFYQPKISTSNCEIVGFEALIRWHHPDGYLAYPGKFIGIAEETGIISSIGNWAIMEACKQIKQWEEHGYEFVVAVNVSARQLVGTDLFHVVKNAIETYNINPQHLELEITESVIMQEIERDIQLLEQLRTLKVGIALDDFGTGYSSMSYIKSLPITKLKIDKSFIDHIEDNAQKEIIKSMISLGQTLNFIINIEGVEREEQFKILQAYKADEIQGFLFSKALPIQDLPNFIRSFSQQFRHLY